MPDESQYPRIFKPSVPKEADAVAAMLERFRAALMAKAEHLLAHDPGLRSKFDAADLVQETFIKANTDFHQCQSVTDEGRLAWLYVIMKNRKEDMCRWYRASKRAIIKEQPQLTEQGLNKIMHNIPDDDPTPSSQCRRKETDEELRKALARIQLPDRDVLIWRAQDDKTFEEIAQALSCSVRQVRYMHDRALVQLHRLLSLRIV